VFANCDYLLLCSLPHTCIYILYIDIMAIYDSLSVATRSGGVVTTTQRSTNNSRSLRPRSMPILDRTDVSFTPATTVVLLLLTACTTTAMMTWTILHSHKYTQLDNTTTPPTSSDTPPPTTTTTFVSHLPHYILEQIDVPGTSEEWS
jgi:hypothetical protein